MRNLIKASKLIITLLLVIMFVTQTTFITMAQNTESYWKVTGWNDRTTVLVAQDGHITESGYGWTSVSISNSNYDYTIYHLMIKLDNPYTGKSDGEALLFKGLDSNGKPIIEYSYGCAIGGYFIHLNPTPPIFEYTPSAFTINGNSNNQITISSSDPIILNANNTTTTNNNYFISVQLSDQYYGRYGTELMEWTKLYNSPYFFQKDCFDIKNFCSLNNFALIPGNYYRIKLAVSPWNETTKLVYIRKKINTVDTLPDIAPNDSSL